MQHAKTKTYLHRFLLSADAETEVDHIDGNTFNNCRHNLRAIPKSENCQNVARPGREHLRNVYYQPERSASHPWKVQLRLNGETISGGTFTDLEEAREAARKLRETHFTHANETRHL